MGSNGVGTWGAGVGSCVGEGLVAGGGSGVVGAGAGPWQPVTIATDAAASAPTVRSIRI